MNKENSSERSNKLEQSERARKVNNFVISRGKIKD